MYLEDRTLFLAGATGLVGSSVIAHLLASHPRTRIRAAYRGTAPHLPTGPMVEYVRGDLRSTEDCRRMVSGCDCAVMAAANTGGAAVFNAEPWTQVTDNVVLNANLLAALRAEGVKRVLYVGSATAYQPFDGAIAEQDLDLNRDPHQTHFGIGWVLRFTEKLCRFWHDNAGMEIVIVRASNVFGPYARFAPGASNFIPALIRKAVDRQDPFEVWGSPEVTRDVLYSEDFASAVVALLDAEQIKFDTFNVGSGERTRVGDVVTWALKAAKHSPSRIRCTDGPTTVSQRGLDCSKVTAAVGWEPRNTPEEGVRKTTEWWMNNRDRWTR